MVTATLGVIAMIAVPRMSSAATGARSAAVRANMRVLQTAVETYAAEHNELTPAENLDGTAVDDSLFMKRLLVATDEAGSTVGGLFGPYLRALPRNPNNKLDTVRIDGVPPGKNDAGWRYNSLTREILPDDPDSIILLAAQKASGGGGLVAVPDGDAESTSATLVVK